MAITVRLKPGHPSTIYHRGGIVFGPVPIELTEGQLTQEILEDRNLIIEGFTISEQENNQESITETDAAQ